MTTLAILLFILILVCLLPAVAFDIGYKAAKRIWRKKIERDNENKEEHLRNLMDIQWDQQMPKNQSIENIIKMRNDD